MLLTPPITTRALAIPASTNLSLIPPPPPPSPPSASDDSGDEGEDGDHDEEHTQSGLPQPPTPSTVPLISITLSSSSSTLLKSTVSVTSTSLAVSSSSSRSTRSETPFTDRTTLSTSITSSTFQSSTPSSLSQSNNNETTSTPTSSTLSASSISTSTSPHSSSGIALPEGQPDSNPHETTSDSSSISTAGIILAAIFSFVALLTTIYLLYRFCRRRNKSSSGSDSEKQNTYTSTAQETGVIFGRRRSGSRTSLNSYEQHDQRSRGGGRSRFSFLNRRWYSAGTKFSGSQQEHRQQQAGHRQSHADTTSTSPLPAPPQWPSPLFFMPNRTRNQNQALNPFTNTQSYPQTPQTATTITRLTNDILINRNTSTRTTDTSGSGHARAYAHHGIRAPHSLVIDVARNTISSISSRWSRGRTRTQQSNSRVSSMASRIRDRATNRDAESVSSPVSEISDLYNSHTYGDRDHNHSSLSLSSSPRIHRLSSSTSNSNMNAARDSPSTNSPTHAQTIASTQWRSSGSSGLRDSTTTSPKTTRPKSRVSESDSRRSRARFTGMPRLPLPVAVSRGSWGSKIDVGL